MAMEAFNMDPIVAMHQYSETQLVEDHLRNIILLNILDPRALRMVHMTSLAGQEGTLEVMRESTNSVVP